MSLSKNYPRFYGDVMQKSTRSYQNDQPQKRYTSWLTCGQRLNMTLESITIYQGHRPKITTVLSRCDTEIIQILPKRPTEEEILTCGQRLKNTILESITIYQRHRPKITTVLSRC